MAKLKRTVLAAVQPHVNSGYYPFWEYTVGMRRKPGFLWAARLGVHRVQTPIITLLVVTQHLDQKIRIIPRLISVDAQNTAHFPILIHTLTSFSAFLHPLMHQLLAVSSTKLLDHSPEATKNLPESSPKLSKHSPKIAKTPPESSPKLPEHSPKHSENTSEILAETSPTSSDNSPESSPELLEHFPKLTNRSLEFVARHYSVYTSQHFKLRNNFLKIFSKKYTVHTTSFYNSNIFRYPEVLPTQ